VSAEDVAISAVVVSTSPHSLTDPVVIRIVTTVQRQIGNGGSLRSLSSGVAGNFRQGVRQSVAFLSVHSRQLPSYQVGRTIKERRNKVTVMHTDPLGTSTDPVTNPQGVA